MFLKIANAESRSLLLQWYLTRILKMQVLGCNPNTVFESESSFRARSVQPDSMRRLRQVLSALGDGFSRTNGWME